jgi:hypothetical protein
MQIIHKYTYSQSSNATLQVDKKRTNEAFPELIRENVEF